MRTSFNYRNGQRATVKRPGTKEYRADYDNKNKQFFEKKKQGQVVCVAVQLILSLKAEKDACSSTAHIAVSS